MLGPLKGSEDDLAAPMYIGDDSGVFERKTDGVGHSGYCGAV